MNLLEEGLSYKESQSNKEKLRQETNEKTQRPKSQTKTVKGDGGRGSFKSKC